MFYYVYVLVSKKYPEKHYTGRTEDLLDRLSRHNSGSVPHTAKHRPWQIDVAISFADEAKAIDFEKYLKSHSGRAFAKRHF